MVATFRKVWYEIAGPALSKSLLQARQAHGREAGDGCYYDGNFSAIDVFLGISLLFLHFRGWLVDFPAINQYWFLLRDRAAFRRAVDGFGPKRDPYNDTDFTDVVRRASKAAL